MSTEFHTSFEWFMQMYAQNVDGRDKNPYVFVTTDPNQMGFSPDVDNNIVTLLQSYSIFS